jgi:hypothetical protein
VVAKPPNLFELRWADLEISEEDRLVGKFRRDRDRN